MKRRIEQRRSPQTDQNTGQLAGLSLKKVVRHAQKVHSQSRPEQGAEGDSRRVSEATWNQRKRNLAHGTHGLRKRTESHGGKNTQIPCLKVPIWISTPHKRFWGLNLKINREPIICNIHRGARIVPPEAHVKLAKKEREFDKLFTEAVDDALTSLGESAKQAIYFHLENKFKIPKKDIPTHIGDFADGLEKIFGLGARFIEILIMRNLYGKTGQHLKWNETKELLFVEYVTAAKQSFSKRD